MKAREIVIKFFGIAFAAMLASSCLILDGSLDDRSLTSFKFTTTANPGLRLSRTATISEPDGEIRVQLPDYLDVTSLAPEFEFDGAEVLVAGHVQASGVTKQDFSKPITYSVVGIDDETTDYKVVVTIVPPSDDVSISLLGIGEILAFDDEYIFQGFSTTFLVHNFPYYYNIDLSRLYVGFATGGARVESAGRKLVPVQSNDNGYLAPYSSDNYLDFSDPVTFVVTAEDGSTAEYVSEITCKPTIDAFAFSHAANPSLMKTYEGVIDDEGWTISVNLPNTVSLSSLVANFNFSGESVTVGAQPQTSGSTANDFGSDLTYVVTGRNAGNSSYIVHVAPVQPSADKALVSIKIGSLYGSSSYVDWNHYTNDLDHVFPSNYSDINVYSLYVMANVTGVRMTVQDGSSSRDLFLNADSYQSIHATNCVDFTAPVTFTIYAEDGSTNAFVAHISKAAQ